MDQGSKLRKPRIRLLQPYLPKEYFDTLQHTLDRHTKQTYHSEAADSQTINVLNPFQKKPQRGVMYTGAQANLQKVAAYLQRKITVNDVIRKSRQQGPNLRYQHSEDVVKRNPYSKSKMVERRQSVLDKSSKMRSGSIAHNNSPSLHRYPKSSLSNPYQQKHKRMISISRNYVSRDDTEDSSTQNLLELGKRFNKQGRLDKAIETFRKVLAIKRLPQAQYLMGVCFMNSGQLQLAINIFYQLIEDHPDYKKNTYLLLAIAYKKQEKYDSALNILSHGLRIFPDDYDCIVYRGKLRMKMELYEEAISDFSSAVKIQPQKGFPYIAKAQCLTFLGKNKQAIQILSKALNTDLANMVYLKRGIALYQLGQTTQALLDLQKYLQIDSNSTDAHYYSEKVHLKDKNISQALLSFDQAIKLDNNQIFVARSVQQILKVRIQQKDFYQAYHVVARADHLDIDKTCVEDWKSFVEGTLLLMKKKYKQGIEVYTNFLNKGDYSKPLYEVQQKNKDKYKFLKPLIHLYRAFGYFSLNDLKAAQADYKRFDDFYRQLKTPHQDFTKEYNMCLIKAIQQFPNSLQYIQKAIELYPHKAEPYLYKALTQTQQYIQSEEADVVDKIRANLDKAVSYLPQLSNNHISNVFFHRAVMNLYVNDFDRAVADIDKAIQKSQDNIPKYFYVRGLIFACCGNFSQSIQDLSVAINLQESFAKAYLQRAKCLQMQGNPNEAFLDLQKYITLKPQDPLIHKYAGFLLFQNCAYQDCLSAFSHGSDLLNDIDIIQTKAKCYFLLGNLSQCYQCLQLYDKQAGDSAFIIDSIIINLLRNIQQNRSTDNYNSCYEVIYKLVNTKRTEGKFFKVMDMYVLLAATQTSRGNYQKALEYFNKAMQLKRKSNSQQKKILSEDSQDQEVEQFGWTTSEVTFCMSLCYLALGDKAAAMDHFEKIVPRQETQANWLMKFKILINQIDDISLCQAQLKTLNASRQDPDKQLARFFKPIKIKLHGDAVAEINLQLSLPQLDPPELLPQFDHQLLLQFVASKVQCKPQAPWITRNSNGVVFTTNVQVFQNLELSATSAAKKNNQEQSAQMQDSVVEMSERVSEVPINRQDLRDHFKLDSQTELKLQRILKKKE